MKKAGRAFLPILIIVVFLVGGISFFFLAGSSPMSVANDFLIALAKGDTKQLTDLGYMEKVSPDQEEAEWKKTLARGQYYRFVWIAKTSSTSSPTTGTVTVSFERNYDSRSAFEETYEIPMVKIDGKWKVDVSQLPRALFPGLPR